MAIEFMSPWQVKKTLEGVVPANKIYRPNWLQSFFVGDQRITNSDTVNFDFEFQTKNIIGMFVAPDADVTPIQLATSGTAELRFSYAKEGLSSPEYEEISTRRLGQQFGQVNSPIANEAADLQAKLALAEQRFETHNEWIASQIILTGGYIAESEKHMKVVYSFGRRVCTTDAEYLKGQCPFIDLTTLNGNGGVGKRAWGSTGGTKAPTPVVDFVKMANTAMRRQPGVTSFLMSDDAYAAFEADLLANYKDASMTTTSVLLRVDQKVLPMTESYQDLNFRRSYALGNGKVVDIFTYSAIYHDRKTGVEQSFWPNGYVAALPPSGGLYISGRIKHPKANWEAMPRWINYWENSKTGKKEWEIHRNFIMGHLDINSLVTWKVM